MLQHCHTSSLLSAMMVLNRQKCRDIFLRRISSNGENTHIIPYVLSNLWIPRKTNVLNSLQIAFIDEVENIIDEQNVAIFFFGKLSKSFVILFGIHRNLYLISDGLYLVSHDLYLISHDLCLISYVSII